MRYYVRKNKMSRRSFIWNLKSFQRTWWIYSWGRTSYKVFNFYKEYVVRYPSLYWKVQISKHFTKKFSVTSLNNSFNKMKLHDIEMQPFNGQSDSWSEFYDNFQCAVHQNCSFSDIQKMAYWNYLKSLLRGSAFHDIWFWIIQWKLRCSI